MYYREDLYGRHTDSFNLSQRS